MGFEYTYGQLHDLVKTLVNTIDTTLSRINSSSLERGYGKCVLTSQHFLRWIIPLLAAIVRTIVHKQAQIEGMKLSNKTQSPPVLCFKVVIVYPNKVE